MAGNSVKFKVDGDASGAIKDLQRVLNMQAAIIGKLDKTAKASKKTAKAAGGIEKAFNRVGTAIVGTAGIAGGIRTVLSLMGKWEQYSERLSQKTQLTAKAMTSFAMLQPASLAKQRVKQAADLGARYGIPSTSPEVFNTVQAMQSLPNGTFETGMKSAEALFKARRAGMNLEGLNNVASAMANRGAQPWRGAAYAYLSGQGSNRTPDLMTKVSRAIPMWEDPALAFASAIPVLAGTSPEEYHTYLKSAGSALGSEQGAPGRLWKKLGVADKTQREKLAALSQGGYVTVKQIQAEGVVEGKAIGLASIASNFKSVATNADTFRRQATPDLIANDRAAREAVLPQMRMDTRLETLAAEYNTAAAFSRGGMRALIQKTEDAAYVKKAQEKGWWFMEKDEGRFGGVNRTISYMLHPEINAQFNLERSMAGVSYAGENASAAGYLQEQIKDAGGAHIPVANIGGNATPAVAQSDILMLVAALRETTAALRTSQEIGAD